jgi:hypothetical protein
MILRDATAWRTTEANLRGALRSCSSRPARRQRAHASDLRRLGAGRPTAGARLQTNSETVRRDFPEVCLVATAGGLEMAGAPLPEADPKLDRRSFIVRDANRQALAYVDFEEEPGRRAATKQLTKEEARRIAANVAKLPERLRQRKVGQLGMRLCGTMRCPEPWGRNEKT